MQSRMSILTIKLLLIAFAGVIAGCNHNHSKRIESSNESRLATNTVKDCAGEHSADAKLRTVSIVPQFSASRIHSDYWPLLTEIGKRTNICFKLEQQKSIPSFEVGLKSGSYDYAFMNPYHQVMVSDIYQPIIRDKQRLLTGIIVTKKGSNINSVQQINGRTLLLPAPNAFGASLLTRAYLDKKNIKFNPKYVKTHQNVYRGVARDSELIGGGVNNTFNRESDELRSNLSVLVETPGYPAHPFSALKELPPEEIKNVQNAWITISKDSNSKNLFRQVQIKIPIKANYTQDYAPLKNLRLEKYVQ